jgi:hypothetical protein
MIPAQRNGSDDFPDDLLAMIPPPRPPRDEMTERFLEFHAANPRVYGALVRFAFEAQAAGYEKYGLSDLMGRVRWELQVVDRDPRGDVGDDFKINDHYSPYYARLIMNRHETLRGMFDLRRSIADADVWIGDAA